MTEKEIISALKGNINDATWLDEAYIKVSVDTLKNVIDLINRQQTEIDRLKAGYVTKAFSAMVRR